MVPAPLWQVSVRGSAEAEEALMTLLGQRFASAPSAYRKAGSPSTTVSVFLDVPPDSGSLQALRDSLGGLRGRRRGFPTVEIRSRRIRREDWAESWKKHFPPLVVGPHLVIQPGWSSRRPARGQHVVVLDPGLSFGTGHHPTTLFCLRQTVVHRPRRAARSFLDLGTGSGILSIAAAKLGYTPIHAIDHDPEAIRVAKRNARRNRVGARIKFRELELNGFSARDGRTYDLVVANLTSDLLIHRRRLIARLVKKGGALVLAGILRREFFSLAAAYCGCGFRLALRSSRKEWSSGCFQWTPEAGADPPSPAPGGSGKGAKRR
jgi:ribosomal protein L11 methyltransferase